MVVLIALAANQVVLVQVVLVEAVELAPVLYMVQHHHYLQILHQGKVILEEPVPLVMMALLAVVVLEVLVELDLMVMVDLEHLTFMHMDLQIP